jgi:hypothetical protein
MVFGLAAPPTPLACFAALCAVPLPLRYIVQALPVLLVSGILVVMSLTRCIQIVQQRVFHVLPFGALGSMTLSDICVGILISGLFMLYFGEHITVCCFVCCTHATESVRCACSCAHRRGVGDALFLKSHE